jgi:hypothetical protein
MVIRYSGDDISASFVSSFTEAAHSQPKIFANEYGFFFY